MCGPRESGLKTPTIKTPLCGPRESGLETRLPETHLTTPQKVDQGLLPCLEGNYVSIGGIKRHLEPTC